MGVTQLPKRKTTGLGLYATNSKNIRWNLHEKILEMEHNKERKHF